MTGDNIDLTKSLQAESAEPEMALCIERLDAAPGSRLAVPLGRLRLWTNIGSIS
jgi:hypothetical protein